MLYSIHLRDGFQPGYQTFLLRNIVHINFVVIHALQRIFSIDLVVIFSDIFGRPLCPRFIRRNKLRLGHLVACPDLHTDLFHFFLGRPVLKKYGNRNALFRRAHDVLEVQNDRIKKSEQKQTSGNRRNGSKGKQLVPENVDYALFQRIKKCTNPHRYNRLFLRR